MKKIITLSLLLLLSAAILPAQEAPSLDSIFRWFPDIPYESVSFKNLEQAKKQDGFQKYLDFKRKEIQNWAEHIHLLPFELRDKWLTQVVLQSFKARFVDPDDTTGVLERSVDYYRINEKEYAISSYGYPMQVLSFPLDIDLKKTLTSQDSVKQTELSLFQLPVYHYQVTRDEFTPPSEAAKTDLYFAITQENQILTCENLDLLKDMLAAGNYQKDGILNDFPFPSLTAVLDHLGSEWKIHDSRCARRALIKKMDRENISGPNVEGYRRSLETMPLSVHTSIFTKEPQMIMAQLYNDEERAKKSYDYLLKAKREGKKLAYYDEVNTLRMKYTKIQLYGPMVAHNHILSEAYLEEYRPLREKSDKKWDLERQKAINEYLKKVNQEGKKDEK